MALFPPGDITILDNFNRADGAVYAGAGATLWDTIRRDGAASDLTIVSNKCSAAGSGERGGATLETVTDFIRVVTLDTVGATGMYFGFRLSNLGASHDGYLWTGLGGNWTLWSVTGGVFTSIGGGAGPGLGSGQKVAFRSVGNVHEVWVNSSGTPVWPSAPVASVTDGASLYSSGRVTLEAGGTGWVFENYASASNVAPSSAVTMIVDPDHAAASDTHNRTQAANPATPLASIEMACYLARAAPGWADGILVKRCVTANLGDANDPHIYPVLNHAMTNSAVVWPFADNTGNPTIVMRGDTSASTGDFDNLPKSRQFNYRHLTNWKFQDIQFGYDMSSEAERIAGTGFDYLTWGVAEKVRDITYQGCLFTGGGMIVGNWAGDFTLDQCRTHAPLSPGQFGVFDGEGFGFSGSASDGSADMAHGHIIVSGSEFIGIRGNDALRMDGCFADGLTWDDDFDLHVTDCLFQNVLEQNLVYHTDSIQIVSVPRATILRNRFIGCTDALMSVDGHHGTLRFENNLISGPNSPTPLQNAGTDHLIVRHNTFDVKPTTPKDASLGFIDRYVLPVKTVLECVDNIFGGFFMRDSPIETYFHPSSVIADNVVTSNPGWVTPYGTNLPGLPEFGTSARLNVIPNDVVMTNPETTTVPMARDWELSNTPVLSPGIGQGQVTDIASDLLGRAYTSPPDVGCLQSSPGTPVTPSPRPPYVLQRFPAVGATGVPVTASPYVVTYPLPGVGMDLATLGTGYIVVQDPGGTGLPATAETVAADGLYTTTLTIDGELLPWVVYRMVVSASVADLDGNEIGSDVSWTFRAAGTAPGVGSAGDPPATASHVMDSPWPVGTTVKVYRDTQVPGQPPGVPVTSAVVSSASILTFSGLELGLRYVAWANGFGVRFLVPAPIYKTIRIA